MTGPVRIVPIGDYHVRGHLYPLIPRRCLEHDFGAEAVYPDTISYRTEGLVTLDNGTVWGENAKLSGTSRKSVDEMIPDVYKRQVLSNRR